MQGRKSKINVSNPLIWSSESQKLDITNLNKLGLLNVYVKLLLCDMLE
jgi:hypothetical protein